MKVSPITSRNCQQNTNFKSKLPAMNYKYTKGYRDYWNEFAEQCFQEGKGSRLKNALDKLKSNSASFVNGLFTYEYKFNANNRHES